MSDLLHAFEGSEFTAPQIAFIEAAERLFAERTIESVSLREIAMAAGNGNNNAVQYHFGSKEALIDAVFLYRVRQMDAPRRAMLEQMERDNALRDARRIAEGFCLPLLNLTDASGRHTYAGFLAQYIVRDRPKGLRHAFDTASESTAAVRRLRTLVEQLRPDLSTDILQMRLGLAHLIFMNMLIASDNENVPANRPEVLRHRIEDALNLASAVYLAPSPRLLSKWDSDA